MAFFVQLFVWYWHGWLVVPPLNGNQLAAAAGGQNTPNVTHRPDRSHRLQWQHAKAATSLPQPTT